MDRKRMLLGSLTGQVAAVGLLAWCGTLAPVTWSPWASGIWSPALAIAHAESGSGRGGDGGGSSGSGNGGSGSGGSSTSDGGSGGSGSSGSGSGSGGGGSSGRGSGGDDSGGSGRGGSGDSSDDGASHSGPGRSGSDAGTTGRGDRPRATIDLSDREVEAVLRGEHVLVDDRGRALEVEVEVEHGIRTVTVKPHGGDFARNPGPIGSVHAVDTARTPAGQAVVQRRDGTLEVEIEHGVVTTKPHGGGRPVADRDPVQVGGDLTPAEETSLIQGGWQ